MNDDVQLTSLAGALAAGRAQCACSLWHVCQSARQSTSVAKCSRTGSPAMNMSRCCALMWSNYAACERTGRLFATTLCKHGLVRHIIPTRSESIKSISPDSGSVVKIY